MGLGFNSSLSLRPAGSLAMVFFDLTASSEIVGIKLSYLQTQDTVRIKLSNMENTVYCNLSVLPATEAAGLYPLSMETGEW